MSETGTTQTELLARIDDERTWWDNTLDQARTKGLEKVGVTDKWSFKDLVGHINGWQRRTLDRIAAGINGAPMPQSPWPAEFDAIEDEDVAVETVNDWIYQQNRDRSAADVIAESGGQWDELRALVASAPEAALNDASRFPTFEGQSLAQAIQSGELFSHIHEEHGPMIRDWLASGNGAG